MSYLQLSELCQKHFPDLAPSELAGMLHGLMANGFTREKGQWQQQLAFFINSGDAFAEDAEKELESLLGQTLNDYQMDSFSINLLIPDDESPLSLRAKAVGEWAQGYMSGYGLLKMRVELKEDGKEALQDLSEISKIDFEVEDDDEEMEVALETVAEHVKMSAQIIYLASQPEPAKTESSDKKPQLH